MLFNRKHTDQLSDEELIALYQKASNNKYVNILYERYYYLVLGVCLKYLKSNEESEDAVTLIFEKLLIDLKSQQLTNFKSWLYAVTKNYCLQQLRKKVIHKVDYKELENVLVVPEESNTEQKELIIKLLEAKILLLKEEQKECLTLFYLNKKSYEDIASLTNYDVKAVKSHIQNGKRNLKILLEKEYNQLTKE